MLNIREARFRSNPQFRLIPFDQLSGAERRTFASLSQEADFYGVLVPPAGSVLPIKSVSRDAALLFLTLRQPGHVPHLLTSLFPAGAEDQLRQLVLDGVLELEEAGRFLSGLAALSLLAGDAADPAISLVAKLSLDAIAYAAALDGLSTGEVAAHLYMFNRCPNTRALQQRFADENRVIAFLSQDGTAAKQLQSTWTREVSQESWLMWHSNAAERVPASTHTYKLYISPALEDLPQAFAVAIDSFLQVGCSQFKIGRSSGGLLRPDKFVAYFRSLEQLQEAAELIRASAAGITAQGVPFTAAIDTNGLVSWGMDPPPLEQVLPWQAHQSWRTWVTERVAVYTLAAKEAGGGQIADFVLQRVALDAIDPATWTPNLAIWRGRAATQGADA